MYGKMAIEVYSSTIYAHCIFLGAVSFLDPVCLFTEHFPTIPYTRPENILGVA